MQAPKQVIATDALPLTGLGKPDKKALRAQYWTGERSGWLAGTPPSPGTQLATLVPELLLIGQLIDRSGMAWCISAFGREEMAQIADRGVGRRPRRSTPGGCSGRSATRRRGHRRRHDLQGPPARHRRAAAVHGLPLHGARPVARRVPPRPLRRAHGRRADGAGLRALDVPRHRGPDVRRHRGRHQPAAQVRPIHRPPRASTGPAPALRVDGDHRRVPPRGRSRSRPSHVVAASHAARCRARPDRPG